MKPNVAYGLSILVISLFLWVLFTTPINYPSFDDFDTTFHFLKGMLDGQLGALEKVKLLFRGHSEHRIAFSRVVTLAYYHCFGDFDFRNMVIFQNILLFGIYFLIFRIARSLKIETGPFLLTITCFSFSLSFWQISFFNWGGIISYAVLFFVMLCLYLVHLSKGIGSIYFWLAFFTGLLAMHTYGSGLLVIPLGGFILWARRDWRGLAVWSLLLLVYLAVDILLPGPIAHTFEGLRIDWMARLFFTFLGNFVYMHPDARWLSYANIILCMALGAVVCWFWVREFLNGNAAKNPLLYSLISFPVLTGVLVALSRYHLKAAAGIAPRFMVYTTFIPVFILLYLSKNGALKKKWVTPVNLFSFLLWCLVFVNCKSDLDGFTEGIRANFQRWKADHQVKLVYYSDENYSGILEWAIDNGVWKEPAPAESVPVSDSDPAGR